MKQFLFAIALCAAAMMPAAHAETVALQWVDSGSYDEYGNHRPVTTNYIAGNCTICYGQSGVDFHNFFVFDTSALRGTVTSGILRLRNGYVAAEGLYSVYDVTTAVPTLRAGGFDKLSTFDDLGSGALYGSAWVLPSDITGRAFVDVVLNAAALAALNASGGMFALGGNYAGAWHAFGGTDTDERRQLILEVSAVPEPSSVALMGAGLALAGLARRRASRTALARKDLWTVRA